MPSQPSRRRSGRMRGIRLARRTRRMEGMGIVAIVIAIVSSLVLVGTTSIGVATAVPLMGAADGRTTGPRPRFRSGTRVVPPIVRHPRRGRAPRSTPRSGSRGRTHRRGGSSTRRSGSHAVVAVVAMGPVHFSEDLGRHHGGVMALGRGLVAVLSGVGQLLAELLDHGLHGFDVVVRMVVIGARGRRVVGWKRGLASAAKATQAPSPGQRRRGWRRFDRVVGMDVWLILGTGEGTAPPGPSAAWSPLRRFLRRGIQFELGDLHQGPGTAGAPLPPRSRSRSRLLRGWRSRSRTATGAPGASRALGALVAFGRRQGVHGGHRGVARGRGRWTTRSGLGASPGRFELGLGRGPRTGRRLAGDGSCVGPSGLAGLLSNRSRRRSFPGAGAGPSPRRGRVAVVGGVRLAAGVLRLLAVHGRMPRSRKRSAPAPGVAPPATATRPADGAPRPRALDPLAATRPDRRLGKRRGRSALGGRAAAGLVRQQERFDGRHVHDGGGFRGRGAPVSAVAMVLLPTVVGAAGMAVVVGMAIAGGTTFPTVGAGTTPRLGAVPWLWLRWSRHSLCDLWRWQLLMPVLIGRRRRRAGTTQPTPRSDFLLDTNATRPICSSIIPMEKPR